MSSGFVYGEILIMVKIGSVSWPGIVGIGAGIIKGEAVFLDYASRADSLEIGSITKSVCYGNEGQTIWRTKDSKTLRHNAGLPNPGAEEILNQLKEAQVLAKVPWGINVAVTPGITDVNEAVEDLRTTVRTVLVGGLRPSWITYNVSSPDTVDEVAALMDTQRVAKTLDIIKLEASDFNLPVWLKIGPLPDLNQLRQLINLGILRGVDGFVVSNAVRDANGLVGGWCGELLWPKMLELVKMIRGINGQIPIVAVGGIFSGQQVREVVLAGAQAVQVVSAMLILGRDAAVKIKGEYEQIGLE